MKYILYVTIILLIAGCSNSRKLVYSFESNNIKDSINTIIKRYEPQNAGNYKKIKWFALLKENLGSYEVIINQDGGVKKSPFKGIVKKSNRYLQVDEGFRIPVIFDADFLSDEFRKLKAGSVNFGGFYFKIVKENGEYKVTETCILF